MTKKQMTTNTIELLCDGDKNSKFRKYFTIEMAEKFNSSNIDNIEERKHMDYVDGQRVVITECWIDDKMVGFDEELATDENTKFLWK